METYFKPIHDWCSEKGVLWTGHPQGGSDLAAQRFLHIPGQDLVWRWVLPKEPIGLEGPESTQAKVSSSAMIHFGRRRNVNECFGAYGHDFTSNDMKNLADWCFVRGVNMLTPHAAFYSVRGPRRDERPPDIGPHSAFWEKFDGFAAYASRLSWLNTDSRHQCAVAILADPDGAPWGAARICYQNQCDFNYLDPRHFLEDAVVDENGIHLAGMTYHVLIVDEGGMIQERIKPVLEQLVKSGRVVFWAPGGEQPLLRGMIISRCSDCLIREIRRLTPQELIVEPKTPDLRVRHVLKDDAHYFLLVNEGKEPISFRAQWPVAGRAVVADPMTGEESELAADQDLTLGPVDSRVVRIVHA